jgi:hypothetical protein
MKKKNLVIFLLLLLALAIWSHNLYRIFVGVTQADQEIYQTARPEAEAADLFSQANAQSKVFFYQAGARDPFAHWLHEEKKPVLALPKPQIAKVEKPEPAPPALRFSGIVGDTAGVLAVIESPSGEIHFAKEGEIIAGVRLVTIGSQEVECEFEGKKYQLVLRP